MLWCTQVLWEVEQFCVLEYLIYGKVHGTHAPANWMSVVSLVTVTANTNMIPKNAPQEQEHSHWEPLF